MPRLPPWLLQKAKQQSPDLAALLPACRDLASARTEFRWLKEHAQTKALSKSTSPSNQALVRAHRDAHLSRLCRQRGRGVPLQYLLGSQPFGDLDIKCRPGVLIPRPETEASVCHLVDLMKKGKLLSPNPSLRHEGLNIVDFCTGTGCIPLLLFSSLQPSRRRLTVLGIDVATDVLQLAQENLRHNEKLGVIKPLSCEQSLRFARADVFDDGHVQAMTGTRWDVLVSNPPYVSQHVWDFGHGQLAYSVRKYEPKLALVPADDIAVPVGWRREDVFYSRLLDIAILLKTKVVWLELGDEAQARRVLAGFATRLLAEKSTVEVWRDWPDLTPAPGENGYLNITTGPGQEWAVPVKGAGQIRSIFLQMVVE
ncbi:Modification methylase HemK [Drechmeria coniospora]|uniref:Modification methylase HemK n=1 Tax=Drechmeria coniospora TaxID=98403 RepID=A0A151GIM5_DRECN|nr:Modification methylase HemK [Drechmeria coniospora]KYK56973.1 Modification methylase HemK [Drechmeria coniospora]ODA80446.1 hypothetical protein RJ55_03404 [Drechmeria coniospora]